MFLKLLITQLCSFILQALKNFTFSFFIFLFSNSAFAQNPFRIVQNDTIVEQGAALTLSIDSIKAYSNFIFSAKDPESKKWTIWRKGIITNKYEQLFDDNYNRLHVVVAEDKSEIIYVKYKTQNNSGMHDATMDSAWVCRSTLTGTNEKIIFEVPEFNKNAIYDLDWSRDKVKILYALGNDQYPTLTRDGDIFEYNCNTGNTTNLTNNWKLWSNHCKYSDKDNSFAYSHYANFWYTKPTDIYIINSDKSNVQQTTEMQHTSSMQYCTLTDFKNNQLLYRRGEFLNNKLFVKNGTIEQLATDEPGYGGIFLTRQLIATTDTENNILFIENVKTIGNVRISGIENFACDNNYNYNNNFNTHLNWLGKQKVNVQWSTGDTTFSIIIQPKKTSTYTCKISANGTNYEYSIKVKTGKTKPNIVRECLSLKLPGHNNYQWLLNNIPITGATDSAYTPENGGDYAVRATDKSGRAVTSYNLVISETEADSLNNLNEQIKITPDPTSSLIRISAPVPVNLMVTNETGRSVYSAKNAQQVDMNDFPDGVYYLVLYDNNCLKLKIKKIKKKGD